MTMQKEPSPVLALAAGSAFGTLMLAGTFPIREEETTGFFVACSREQLAALPSLPMYRVVVIVERDKLLALERNIDEMRSVLQQMLDVAENADETGYVTDVGFVDLEKLHAKVRAYLSPNPTAATSEVPFSPTTTLHRPCSTKPPSDS